MTFTFSNWDQGEVPLLFLPGWGFDYQIIPLYGLFAGERLLLADSFFSPATFQKDLLHFLDRHSCEKIRIAGWSMGAQLALEFSMLHPGYVDSLQLIAMRQKWPESEIAVIRQGIEGDMLLYMKSFYRKCFLGYKKAYKEFVCSLQDDYLMKLNRNVLLQGLDYLQNYNVPDGFVPSVPVHVLHGRKDIVAPVKERIRIPESEEKVLDHSGHMVLLDLE